MAVNTVFQGTLPTRNTRHLPKVSLNCVPFNVSTGWTAAGFVVSSPSQECIGYFQPWDSSWDNLAELDCRGSSNQEQMFYLVWTQVLQEVVWFLAWDVDDASSVMFWKLREKSLSYHITTLSMALEAIAVQTWLHTSLLVKYLTF